MSAYRPVRIVARCLWEQEKQGVPFQRYEPSLERPRALRGNGWKGDQHQGFGVEAFRGFAISRVRMGPFRKAKDERLVLRREVLRRLSGDEDGAIS